LPPFYENKKEKTTGNYVQTNYNFNPPPQTPPPGDGFEKVTVFSGEGP
jgi:hypothetical protein